MSGLSPVPDPAPHRPGRTLHCRTVSEGGLRHYNHIRDLAPLLVEETIGSVDRVQVPTPSEALLAALGSCLSARIHANATAGGIVVARLELRLAIDVGGSPLWEPPGGRLASPGYELIRIGVHIDADASPEAVRALVAHAVLWSPVANTLHDPVELDVALTFGA